MIRTAWGGARGPRCDHYSASCSWACRNAPGARKRSVGLIELRRGRLKDVGHSRRDVQLDGDVGGSHRGGETRRVIQQDLVRTALDEKRCDPSQIGEQRTERGGRRIGATSVIRNVAQQPVPRQHEVHGGLRLHARAGQGQVDPR